MPFDSRIPFMAFPDNHFDPLENNYRVEQLRGMRDNNALRQLQLQEAQMRLDELTRQRNQQGAVQNAFRNAVQPQQGSYQEPGMQLGGMELPGRTVQVQGPPQLDSNRAYNNLLGVDPMLAEKYRSEQAATEAANQKAQIELQKSLSGLRKDQLDNASKELELNTRDFMMLKQYPEDVQRQLYPKILQNQVQRGTLHPQQVGTEVPAEWPGVQGIDALTNRGMSIKDAVDAERQNRQMAETERHNKAAEASSLLGHQLTKRGQDMTDARQRDQNQIARDTKMELNKAGDQNQLASFEADMDRLADEAKALRDHPGLGGITGIRGKVYDVPGTDAANARAKLDTLRSQTAFNVLQNMRNNSKTGGALGQVSDAEGKLLQNNLAALDTKQSKEELQKSLDKIIAYTQSAKQRANAAINRKYPNAGSSPSSATQQPIYAVNPQTKQRIMSTDGGQTWQAAQ